MKHFPSRRQFLKTAGYSVLGAAALGLAGKSVFDHVRRKEFMAVCSTGGQLANNIAVVNKTPPGVIRLLDVASTEVKDINIPFFGHVPIPHQDHPDQILTFEKWGLRGGLYDMKSGELIAEAIPSEGKSFFGHAAFIADGAGKSLVTSEDIYRNTSGKLVVRDTKTLQIIGQMESYGLLPHDCQSFDNGKIIIVMNQGIGDHPACLAWIDAASGKLLNKVNPVTEPGSNFAHFARSTDGWFIVGGQNGLNTSDLPLHAQVAAISPDGNFYPLDVAHPADLNRRAEALSMTFIGGRGLAAVTVPDTNKVYVWDVPRQRYIGEIDVPSPKGVIPDMHAQAGQAAFLVTSAKDPVMMRVVVNETDLTISTAPDYRGFYGRGSHIAHFFA